MDTPPGTAACLHQINVTFEIAVEITQVNSSFSTSASAAFFIVPGVAAMVSL
jgi:hypothetical protein